MTPHDHGQGAAFSAGARHRHRLTLAFAIIAAFFVLEAAAALWTRSLALWSDAGHMLTDVGGLGMALAAIHLAAGDRGDHRKTFGLYRLEILAALGNAALLFGVAGWVLWEAVRRLREPPDVLAVPMLVVACAGLLANLAAFFLLRPGASESINVRGAYLEVLSDTIGSAGAIAAAVVLQVTGWRYVDPIVAAAVGIFILPRTWRLASQAVRILIQAAPPHIDPKVVTDELAALPGVVDVHDVHLWTLTSDMEVASAHLRLAPEANGQAVLDAARRLLQERHRVSHATLQVEAEGHRGCDELTW